ncbi:MAG TPA: hypothetical protein VK886_12185 [Vicinamibacterales bacterium]|nr:hypothetical protein [Vicinamibacterales bacterium]
MAQQWKELYDSGDVFRALPILQPLVFEAEPIQHDLDPMAPLYLATYYMNGWGVEKDPLFACGLGMAAQHAAHMRPRYPEPLRLAIDAFVEKTCSQLSGEDRSAAILVANCPNVGLRGQMLQLGNGSWLEITRKGFVIDYVEQPGETPLVLGPGGCAQHVLPARATSVPLPDGRARHFVELFAWVSGRQRDDGTPGPGGQLGRALFWTVYEVVEGGIEPVGGTGVAQEPGSAWPAPPFPEKVRTTFRAIENGEVSCTVRDAAGKEKTEMLRSQADVILAIRARRKASGS